MPSPGTRDRLVNDMRHAMTMRMMKTACGSNAGARILLRAFCLVGAAIAFESSIVPAAQSFEGPNFRKGMWHFERTLEHNSAPYTKILLMKQEMTRCVDPTNAMRDTFASPNVGNCHSARPEKVSN